jgi:hypothetical protein
MGPISAVIMTSTARRIASIIKLKTMGSHPLLDPSLRAYFAPESLSNLGTTLESSTVLEHCHELGSNTLPKS